MISYSTSFLANGLYQMAPILMTFKNKMSLQLFVTFL